MVLHQTEISNRGLTASDFNVVKHPKEHIGFYATHGDSILVLRGSPWLGQSVEQAILSIRIACQGSKDYGLTDLSDWI